MNNVDHHNELPISVTSIYLVVIVESTPAVSNYDENNDHKKQENESSKKADHHAKVVCGKKARKKQSERKTVVNGQLVDLVSCHSDSAEAVLVRHEPSREKIYKVCGTRVLKYEKISFFFKF